MEFYLENMGLREPEDWTRSPDLAGASSGTSSLGGPAAEQYSITHHPAVLRMDSQHWPVQLDVLPELGQEECLSVQSLETGLLWPADSLGVVDHFPCIADELEEQAKQLEEDWLLRPSPTPLSESSLRPIPRGVLQRFVADCQQQQQQQQQLQRVFADCRQQQGEQQRPQTPKEGEAPERQASELHEEPVTPQRHSTGNDSSWNESPLPGSSAGLDAGEVQSPARVELLPTPNTSCYIQRPRPPLATAIHNAQSVRLGREPAQGAWRGCGRSAWCSMLARHHGGCDAAAAVPGLLAYPPQELFQSGVNIEELCRVPEELEALAPDTDSEGEATCPAATTADCLSSGKRHAEAEADDGASHTQSGGGTASSGSLTVAVQQEQEQEQERPAKRVRAEVSSHAATSSLPLPLFPVAPALPDPLLPLPELVGSSLGRTLNPLMHPPMVPQPPGPPLDPAALLGIMLPPFAPSVPVPNLGAYLRNLGRPAGAPRLRPLPVVSMPLPPPAAPAVMPAANTPNKPVTRQKHNHTPTGAAGPSLPRSSGRKTVLQWHTDSVVDPRTGATVTSVQPGTFCTQCFALSTPVWRAGPFGHKTLCNACGVRWMKYAKGSKK